VGLHGKDWETDRRQKKVLDGKNHTKTEGQGRPRTGGNQENDNVQRPRLRQTIIDEEIGGLERMNGKVRFKELKYLDGSRRDQKKLIGVLKRKNNRPTEKIVHVPGVLEDKAIKRTDHACHWECNIITKRGVKKQSAIVTNLSLTTEIMRKKIGK